MSPSIAENVALLTHKKNSVAYEALRELQKASEETDSVYPYMDRFSDMLDSDNAYIRTRGLTLIACNARWDQDHQMAKVMDRYLKHITDVKPITARQCIKLLPRIARDRPELKAVILSALRHADLSVYQGSMRPLVLKDIQQALNEIQP